jgi:NADH:ubiquinone oxidoreductase subunit 4 (subunit M)
MARTIALAPRCSICCSASGSGPITTSAGHAQWQFVRKCARCSGRFAWKLGIDGIALMLIMLSVFLMPICIGASWAIEKRVGEYMAAFLLMETLMIGVFAAQDLFLFYIFFEAGLIPMYLIIGIWGGGTGSTRATSSSSTRCSARC